MEGQMNQGNRDDRGTFEQTAEQIGGAAGRAVGRGTDMAFNMFGSFFGSAMNSLGEWWTSADAQLAAQSFDQTRDSTCRAHFETEASAEARDYDEVRPLYQFGHMAGQNPSYRGRDFEDIEPDLERAWNQEQRQTDWPEVRGYVGFGFNQHGDQSTDR
jgi:hypothetical protein